jgi:hypothetical protein
LRILFDATDQPVDRNGIVKVQIHGKKMRGVRIHPKAGCDLQ